MIKQMASLKFYIIIIVTSFVLVLFHYPKNISDPQCGRILLLLTIKARRKFCSTYGDSVRTTVDSRYLELQGTL